MNDPSMMKATFIDFSLGDTLDVRGIQASSAVFNEPATT